VGDALQALLADIRQCRLCADSLPLGPRPVVQASNTARILIAGQAPGLRVHETGLPFDDPSGNRLRAWMGIDRDIFYDPRRIAIVPMGFCYPGRAAGGGDAPPDPRCRKTWHDQVMAALPAISLTLVIGQYAQAYHLGARGQRTVTETVAQWRDFAPRMFVLPHPSPRNNIWLKRNPWFDTDVVPILREHVQMVLAQ